MGYNLCYWVILVMKFSNISKLNYMGLLTVYYDFLTCMIFVCDCDVYYCCYIMIFVIVLCKLCHCYSSVLCVICVILYSFVLCDLYAIFLFLRSM